MSQPLRVAIQGFSAFERSTFEAFFRLSTRRTPAYEYCARLRDSDLVIADGDRPDTLGELTRTDKLARTLWVGATREPGVAQHLRRPINLMALVKLLDQMLLEAAPDSTAPATNPTTLAAAPPPARPAPEPVSPLNTPTQPPAPSQSQRVLHSLAMSKVPMAPVPPEPRPRPPSRSALPVLRVVEPAAPLPPAVPSQAAPTVLDAFPATDIAPIPSIESGSAAEPGRAAMDHILVVDDSDIALRFMANRLERFGFVVHLCRSGEEAIVRTEQQHFTFVFMDVTMPGLDGFKTCKTIKRRHSDTGQAPPVIVMLTSRDTPIDKLRGTMAGCDGYLTKPLDENELFKIIGDREVQQHAFAQTAQAERND